MKLSDCRNGPTATSCGHRVAVQLQAEYPRQTLERIVNKGVGYLASLPGVKALSTFASHWVVDHDDLTVVTMGMDDTMKKPTRIKEKAPREQKKKTLLIIMQTTQHTLCSQPRSL